MVYLSRIRLGGVSSMRHLEQVIFNAHINSIVCIEQ